MPAVSKAQRRFFGMLEHNPSMAKARGVKMTHQQMHDFAATKDAGLPEHSQHAETQFRHRDSNKPHPHAKMRTITK